MTEKQTTLELSIPERLCVVGILVFVLSLLLPAARMGGGATDGLSWFALGTITALMPSGNEVNLLSLVALVMNASSLVTVIAIFNRWQSPRLFATTAFLGFVCALILLAFPYSQFDEIYVGYYLWILSAFWFVGLSYRNALSSGDVRIH